MLSKFDRWLTTPPESNVPEMDAEDEQRILLDILWKGFKSYALNVPEEAWRRWMDETILANDCVFEGLMDEHHAEIDQRWAEEHSDPLDDGDQAYEVRCEREWEKE